ncbi:Glucosyltransferase-like protein [Exophiala dermatitidis]|uniref:Alpha-1,3-glucosyltransferase n=2 Tax=Exophiala dermatitidis TaxID=5970 RepID=H6C5I9_EXODN|nr:alpha-1,3-glucosyltransferase [Exophiala dermatitidis NIH/UT8656]KAJ4505408.1 Glucosyltransferase-like protein [Exophiala dermatitidis]EHY59847.1 alpha-1,3-glucosyltransferase [Exophiala dermatitidis NIH/UT8656]KAJ4507006.1 Glucosyltransferase-like protein [Exophiala dermatitidis]KAJ4507602.1 Glucosyltransferase-like protein [Exophiala dermatitidis]KAJ4533098.1 Glucosyltransferase-like protein [Exophiala dermatitidis]
MSGSSQSHRPRKKRKQLSTLTRSPTITDIVKVDAQDNAVSPEFPLVAFLWPSRGTTSQWILLPLILMVVAIFRWSVGLWGYSGYQQPPMHGDFEAQRHWMEITTHLPVSRWYFYDLQYWGLDYPPLTAYHSWVCGKIGSLFNEDWFALDSSRGLEDPTLKVFMRATVLVSEYLVYIPALVVFLRHYSRSEGTGTTSVSIALVAILMQPATMLIDHGHFQYNTVMLGFVVATLSSIYAGRLLWSCVFFVAALGFKQMALYYSPIVFAYLLGSCIRPRIRFGRFVAIAAATILAFVVLFAPLLLGALYESYTTPNMTDLPTPPLIADRGIGLNPNIPVQMVALQLSQVIHRVFPFARGLFEDKVANFWCFTNTFYKLRKLEGIVDLSRISAVLTLASVSGPMLIVAAVPKKALLPYALATSAWGFFLFSFQVHEKSVLLPLLPMTLLLGSSKGLSKEYRAWIGWANLLGVWTMYPLLKRDGLQTPYVVVSLLWSYLMGLPPTSTNAYYDPAYENVTGRPLAADDLRTPTKILHFQTYIVMAFWHLLAAFATPPEDKPDLWVVSNACIGALCFGVCYLWCYWKLVSESGLLNELGNTSAPAATDKSKSHQKSIK